MKIRFDKDRCTGHGRCYALAPELFDADEMGHCLVLAEEVPGDLEEKAVLAVNTCPEGALSLEGA
jgi:ferredoxin